MIRWQAVVCSIARVVGFRCQDNAGRVVYVAIGLAPAMKDEFSTTFTNDLNLPGRKRVFAFGCFQLSSSGYPCPGLRHPSSLRTLLLHSSPCRPLFQCAVRTAVALTRWTLIRSLSRSLFAHSFVRSSNAAGRSSLASESALHSTPSFTLIIATLINFGFLTHTHTHTHGAS